MPTTSSSADLGAIAAEHLPSAIHPSPEPDHRAMTGIRQGITAILPVSLAVLPFAMVWGALAAQNGLSWLETVLMSTLVMAGASQAIILSMWDDPLPVLSMVIAAVAVNARFVLMSVSIFPIVHRLPRRLRLPSLFALSDENWAITLQAFCTATQTNPYFYIGASLPLYLFWIAGGAIGHPLGDVIDDPAKWGVDLAFPTAFAALLITTWRGRGDGTIWLVAALAAMVGWWWLPEGWRVIAGGLSAAAVGAWRGVTNDES